MASSVHDIAAYIRQQCVVSRKKLLKLVYYAQAWSLVWDGRPLFTDDVIEAWPEGPVPRALWIDERHANGSRGNADALDGPARATVDEVLRFYGRFDGDQLGDLTHHEEPWQHAREGLASSAPSRRVVTTDAMYAFYSKFASTSKKLPVELARGIELMLSVPPDERGSLFEESDDDCEEFMRELQGA